MDQLVEKWKRSSNVTANRYSEKKVLNSSSSEEELQKSPKRSPAQRILAAGQKSGKKLSDDKKTNEVPQRKVNGPPTFSAALDQCTHHLVQISRQSLSQPKLIEQIKLQLVEFAENMQALGSGGYAFAQIEELQLKIKSQEQVISNIKSSSKEDIGRRIINELEEKLLESEKQRVKLKSQKDQMQVQIERIQEQLNKFQVTQDFLHQLKLENQTLRKNNDALLEQINQMVERDREQQTIWQYQVEDLIRMMDILKKQFSN